MAWHPMARIGARTAAKRASKAGRSLTGTSATLTERQALYPLCIEPDADTLAPWYRATYRADGPAT
jgi:hypothetical protein